MLKKIKVALFLCLLFASHHVHAQALRNSVNLATGVTGTLPVANGGTGATSLGLTLTNSGGVLNTSTPVNVQSGTTYSIAVSDLGKVVQLTNTNGAAVALPTAGSTNFGDGFAFTLQNSTVSNSVVATAATGTINGQATLTIGANQSCQVYSKTNVWGVTNCTALTQTVLDSPGGRLSPSSAPIPNADVFNVSTIHYVPYRNQLAPVWNGSQWVQMNTGADLPLVLNATSQPSGTLYDFYLINQAGIPTVCAMAWGGSTARSTTAGGLTGTANSAIAQINGIWTNAAAIAAGNCFNGASTSYAIAQNQGTLLGSFTITGTASTAFRCHQPPASGGASTIIGISNVYNRVPITCSVQDSAVAVTSATTSWAGMGGSDNVGYVDSLAQSSVEYDAFIVAGNGALGGCGFLGVSLDSTTATPLSYGATCGSTAILADNYQTISIHGSFGPSLGSHVMSLQKASSTSSTTTYMPITTQENFTVTVQW
jgi:hypothetical protein